MQIIVWQYVLPIKIPNIKFTYTANFNRDVVIILFVGMSRHRRGTLCLIVWIKENPFRLTNFLSELIEK